MPPSEDISGLMPMVTADGAAAAYGLTGTAGALPRFGTSGLAYRSLMLMFDERTRSLWSPLTGAPVLGGLVGTAELRPLH